MATFTIGALLLTATIGQVQTCLHGPDESPAQRARRTAAIRFVQQVNDAEEKLRLQNRKFGHIDELPGLETPPVGFVPRTTVDNWSYSIVLKDLFDSCGFVVFSDQDRVIYEGHPVPTARPPVSPTKGREAKHPHRYGPETGFSRSARAQLDPQDLTKEASEFDHGPNDHPSDVGPANGCT